MAVDASLQSLLELSQSQFDAVARDRVRAHEEAEERAKARAENYPPEARHWIVLGAQEAALQRREQITVAASMRADTLKQQIATLEAMR